MKLLQLDHDRNKYTLGYNFRIIPVLSGIILLFSSCESNNIEKINTITTQISVPTQSVTNAEIIYSEKAKTSVIIKSPEINRYLTIEEPYSEFPKGMHVQFFDSTQKSTAFIQSNYAIYNETTKIWIAEHDVVAVNNGDTLNTEYLVWNQITKKITSDRFVRITNKDGIIHGNSFEANQDMTDWKIKQTSGTINVDNEN